MICVIISKRKGEQQNVIGRNNMKRQVEKYDFKVFGQAIKAARKSKGILRNQLDDQMHIATRYIASIENSGQHQNLQTFYELVTLLMYQ